VLWLKAFHIVFMVTWFAGLFYLPRLFVYHVMSEDQTSRERFQVMERKLFVIMSIGALATVVLGLWLMFGYTLHYAAPLGWLHAKLALAVLLVGYHLYCAKLMRDLRTGRDRRSHVFYRWFNEVPALMLVAMVVLAVVRPF